MRYLFVDSSFLISSMKMGKDLLSLASDHVQEALIFATSKPVLEELENLSKRNDKLGRLAKLALKLASKFEVFDFKGKADDSLLFLCESKKAILATADRGLLRKALEKGIPTIYLKREREIAYFER